MKNKLLRIIRYYGIRKQLKYFQTDVLVMLEQFRQFYDIQMVDVQKIFKEKVERQNQRIDDEINKELSGEEEQPNE